MRRSFVVYGVTRNATGRHQRHRSSKLGPTVKGFIARMLPEPETIVSMPVEADLWHWASKAVQATKTVPNEGHDTKSTPADVAEKAIPFLLGVEVRHLREI